MKDRIWEIIQHSSTDEELVDNLNDFIEEQIWHATIED